MKKVVINEDKMLSGIHFSIDWIITHIFFVQ